MIKINNLSIEYLKNRRPVKAVENISLDILENETIALVGESGCGKSTLALAIIGLVSENGGRISGSIMFENTDITALSKKQWQALRGKEISIIFQDPFSSLNPVMTVGNQLDEAIRTHNRGISGQKVKELAVKALYEVMLDERIYDSYPHQLSGGQRQRMLIAMAIANKPKLLIADEPTTALDVTIQKEILDLLDKIKKEHNLTLMLITHNLPLAKERCNRIAVMYAGKIVELASAAEIFKHPRHPYTGALIESIPKMRKTPATAAASGKNMLSGQPPAIDNMPPGCRFHPRCSKVMDICKKKEPGIYDVSGVKVQCWLYQMNRDPGKS